MKYRKKPIIVDAFQTDQKITIVTPEGSMQANPGDWIITGVHGEKYPCKPDIFAETYEPVDCEQGEKRAAWIWKESDKEFECSRCHGRCLLNYYESDWHKLDFCPHCGADMRPEKRWINIHG